MINLFFLGHLRFSFYEVSRIFFVFLDSLRLTIAMPTFSIPLLNLLNSISRLLIVIFLVKIFKLRSHFMPIGNA